MLNDCKYDKIKLLHELSSLAWFLDKCGLQDAQKSGSPQCLDLFKELRKDLDKYIKALDGSIQRCE